MRKLTTDLIEKIKSSEIFNFDETFNIYIIYVARLSLKMKKKAGLF